MSEKISKEQAEYNDELLNARLKRQKEKDDFIFNIDTGYEKCEDCGSKLNSHGHCPRCDY